MILNLRRFATNGEATLSALSIDGLFSCFGLEDQEQAVKVKDETRIPIGTYKIKLRAEGPMHEKYRGKFSDHRGMLHLQDVPGFEWVYLHVGNREDQTSGCILVGDQALANFEIAQSVQAYRRVYGRVSNAILAGEPVEIVVSNYA